MRREAFIRQGGFTLAELVVAVALTVVLASIVWPLLEAGLGTSRRVPASLDQSQQLRGGIVFVSDLLRSAGGGARVGPPRGRLAAHVPPLAPRRWGTPGADAVAFAAPDRVTVVSVPEGASVAPLTSPVWPGDTLVTFSGAGRCGVAWSCGLAPGETAMLGDVTGRFEVVRIATVAPGIAAIAGELRHAFHPDHDPFIVPILVRAISWREAQREVRLSTGGGADLPVLDGVVGFEVRWFGTSAPPAGPALPPGVGGCLRAADGTLRLGQLGGPDAITALDLAGLADGPWCGEGDFAFDADLLRVRRVEVVLRLEVEDDSLRATGAWFRRPGRAVGPHVVPDAEVRFHVSPIGLS